MGKATRTDLATNRNFNLANRKNNTTYIFEKGI